MMIDMGIMHNGYSWFWGFSPEWLNGRQVCRVIPPHQAHGWESKPRNHPRFSVNASVAAFPLSASQVRVGTTLHDSG